MKVLALLECEVTDRRKGFVQYRAEKILNTAVLHVTIGCPQSSKRKKIALLKETAKNLNDYGVRSVCFHSEFQDRKYFLGHGFERPAMRGLIVAKSVDIISCATEENTEIALLSARADGAVAGALEKACRKFRNITAYFGVFTDMMCTEMERKTGVSIKRAAHPKEFMRADGAVVLGRFEESVVFRPDVPILFVDGERPDSVRGGRQVARAEFFVNAECGKVPDGYQTAELIGAAFSMGGIREAEIGVKNIRLY